MTHEIREIACHFIGENAEIRGELILDSEARFCGKLKGKLAGKPGSQLLIEAHAEIEGEVAGDTIFISGFVEGEIRAKTSVTISRNGRVKGLIEAPSIKIESGAFFEGTTKMQPTSST